MRLGVEQLGLRAAVGKLAAMLGEGVERQPLGEHIGSHLVGGDVKG